MCALHTLDTSKEYMMKGGCTSITENSKLKFSLSHVCVFKFCYHHKIMALLNFKNQSWFAKHCIILMKNIYHGIEFEDITEVLFTLLILHCHFTKMSH